LLVIEQLPLHCSKRQLALSRTEPRAAYGLLYPNNHTAIPELGPAFFTKYLYFAGGGAAGHPCCILDENVALALHKTCGWRSLPSKNWLDTAYDRYAALLARWVTKHRLGRLDVIERWLFEQGNACKAQANASDRHLSDCPVRRPEGSNRCRRLFG
jgi:hypothetical protein